MGIGREEGVNESALCTSASQGKSRFKNKKTAQATAPRRWRALAIAANTT